MKVPCFHSPELTRRKQTGTPGNRRWGKTFPIVILKPKAEARCPQRASWKRGIPLVASNTQDPCPYTATEEPVAVPLTGVRGDGADV
jgi:hypothetical protein